MKDSIADVLHEMATAGALVGLIVLLLLGSWRATVIVWTSILSPSSPPSSALHWLDETINVMTLGGLALAVGILVDDATVMIENIDRHLEMGKPLEQAIVDAANQIVVPTFVATLCIAIVWIPLFELGGVAGYLFSSTHGGSDHHCDAGFFILSRTLVPTMAKYMMKGHHAEAALNLLNSPVRLSPGNIFVRFQTRGSNAGSTGSVSAMGLPARTGHGGPARSSRSPSVIADGLAVAVFLPRPRLLPEIQIRCHSDAYAGPLGTRIEVSGRIATLVSNSVEELPGR